MANNGCLNVVGLVYVAAFAVDEGGSVQGLLAAGVPLSLNHVRPDAQGYLWFDSKHSHPGHNRFRRGLAAVKPVNSVNFGTPAVRTGIAAVVVSDVR